MFLLVLLWVFIGVLIGGFLVYRNYQEERMVTFSYSENDEDIVNPARGFYTQIYYKDQPSKLSARYLVQGIDHTGRGCRIFIENNGIMYDGETITRPVIYTDSIALKWMETASMYGTLTVVEGQPVITIYTDKNKNSGKGEKGSGA